MLFFINYFKKIVLVLVMVIMSVTVAIMVMVMGAAGDIPFRGGLRRVVFAPFDPCFFVEIIPDDLDGRFEDRNAQRGHEARLDVMCQAVGDKP